MDAGGFLKIAMHRVQCPLAVQLQAHCGVELTNSQIEDPYLPLSTQQTTDFIAQFDADHTLEISQDFRQTQTANFGCFDKCTKFD